MMIKKIIKFFIPDFILKFLLNYFIKKEKKKFNKLNTNEVFNLIYKNKIWTPEEHKNSFKFYSGTGSHSSELIKTYVIEVNKFISNFKDKPNVVDLGCGDFFIGEQIRKNCNKYIAVDIVEDLIKFNRIKFRDLDVDFKVLNITSDDLPEGDICFLRQVLQHLSNNLIQNFLNLMKNKYKYLVLTEHLPSLKRFQSNIDMPTSSYIRLAKKSGVNLQDPPFNLKMINQYDLCNIHPKEILNFDGVINTKIIQLK